MLKKPTRQFDGRKGGADGNLEGLTVGEKMSGGGASPNSILLGAELGVARVTGVMALEAIFIITGFDIGELVTGLGVGLIGTALCIGRLGILVKF